MRVRRQAQHQSMKMMWLLQLSVQNFCIPLSRGLSSFSPYKMATAWGKRWSPVPILVNAASWPLPISAEGLRRQIPPRSLQMPWLLSSWMRRGRQAFLSFFLYRDWYWPGQKVQNFPLPSAKASGNVFHGDFDTRQLWLQKCPKVVVIGDSKPG